MLITMHGKALECFDFEEAFQKWIHAKDRGGYAAMVNNLKKMISSSFFFSFLVLSYVDDNV